MTTADVVVVGGGVIGSSIAYHLAGAGARVVVVERSEPASPPSASWASAGGVRQQGRDAREWPLTMEAARRWPNLDNDSANPPASYKEDTCTSSSRSMTRSRCKPVSLGSELAVCTFDSSTGQSCVWLHRR